jgi:hypothetical protein
VPDGWTHGLGDGRSEGVAEGEAIGDAGAEATIVSERVGDGDGSAATRMPQPASSVAAPAAASTLARHLDLTHSLL